MNIQDLLHKSTAYVTASLNEHGIEWRLVRKDDSNAPLTRDYNPKRVNLVIRNDRLADYTYG